MATVVGLVLWVVVAADPFTRTVFLGVGVLHFVRLLRWQGAQTLPAPLLLVLPVGHGPRWLDPKLGRG